MSARKRQWLFTLGVAAALGLTAQGSALASANRSRPVSVPTSCAAVRAERAALAAEGRTRAMCLTQHVVRNSSKSKSGQSPAASIFCPINRFEICTNSAGVISVINLSNGQLVGQMNYALQQDIVMNPNTLTFAENYNMTFTSGSGNILGMMVSLAVTCGQFCSATTNFTNPGPAVVGGSFGGAISYSDFPVLVDSTKSTYTLTASGPGAPGVGVTQSQTYRCDTEIGITGGCVNPGYWPILTTMVNLPTIVQNIRNVQSTGPHHYGRMNGGFPLTRSDSSQTANNNAACPPAGAQPPNTSCDEYPFATTAQGAATSQKPDWGSVWAPNSEQSSQGGFISSFYQSNRVLNGDAFWVQV
jgi:Deoxyribonuclease NucA/NucB